MTRHHRVGEAAVVGRHVGQALDLADDVVAEVAHRARRAAAAGRRASAPGTRASSASSAARMPWSRGHAVGQRRRRPSTRAVAQHERGRRVAADEREAAPALAVLDRLEQEAGAVADELGERGDRRLEVGEQLAPDRHDRVRRGERAELVAGRADAARLDVRSPKRAEEAGALAGVAGARCPPARPRTAACRRRSRSTPRARTGGRRWCRPCATPPGGCGSRTPSGPRRASCAASRRSSTPSSAPRRCSTSWAIAGTSPSASNVTPRAARAWRRSACRSAWRRPAYGSLRGTGRSTLRCARRRRRGCRARAG